MSESVVNSLYEKIKQTADNPAEAVPITEEEKQFLKDGTDLLTTYYFSLNNSLEKRNVIDASISPMLLLAVNTLVQTQAGKKLYL